MKYFWSSSSSDQAQKSVGIIQTKVTEKSNAHPQLKCYVKINDIMIFKKWILGVKIEINLFSVFLGLMLSKWIIRNPEEGIQRGEEKMWKIIKNLKY